MDREKVGKAGTSATVSHCLTLVSCPFFNARNDQRKREKSKQQRENEKDDRKLALVRGVVAKENKIEKQNKIEKRWARRGHLLSLFGYLPL